MLKSQFNFLCNTFGDPNLSESDKWKSIKYIFIENPIANVQTLLKRNEILYVDNSDIGPGFYILSYSNADLGVPKYNERVVTFLPLKLIDKISILASLDINDDDTDDKDDNIDDDENNILYVDTFGDTLAIDNIEAEVYEDVIIINNVEVDTHQDTLIISKTTR